MLSQKVERVITPIERCARASTGRHALRSMHELIEGITRCTGRTATEAAREFSEPSVTTHSIVVGDGIQLAGDFLSSHAQNRREW